MQKINESTLYRKGLRKKIIDAAMMLFKEKGIKAVKMDDIASHLSISKRTLYEIFDNKEDLLLEGVKAQMEKQHQDMERFRAEHDDVLQIILFFYRMKLIEIGSVHAAFFLDMKKYKKVTDYFNSQKMEQKNNALAFFARGVEEGYFLPQLNYDIVTRLGEAAMDYVMSAKMYEEFALKDIFRNFVSVLLRGYCTEKGQAVLNAELWNEAK